MARIKISLPETKVFETSLKVRICDLNYGSHVGNHVFLDYCHNARMEYLKSIDQSEYDLGGNSLIMADSAVMYKSEAFFGEELVIELFLDDLNKYGFDLIYKFTSKEKGHEIARAKTGLVFYNYEKRKIANAPKDLFKILQINFIS